METKPQNISIWMPLMIGDFRRATYDMSHECCGMYMALLIALWENDGQISSNEDDLRMICRASRQEWDRHKLKLSRLFYVGDGCWMHNGIREQLARAKKVSAARSEAGKASSAKRWGARNALKAVK